MLLRICPLRTVCCKRVSSLKRFTRCANSASRPAQIPVATRDVVSTVAISRFSFFFFCRRCDRCNTKFSSPEDLRRHHAVCTGIPPEIPTTVPDPRKPASAPTMVLGTVISDADAPLSSATDGCSPPVAPMEVVGASDAADGIARGKSPSIIKKESDDNATSSHYNMPADFSHPGEDPPAYEAPIVASFKDEEDDETDFSPVKQQSELKNVNNTSANPPSTPSSLFAQQTETTRRNLSIDRTHQNFPLPSSLSPSPSPERGDSDGASPEHSQQRGGVGVAHVRSASSSASNGGDGARVRSASSSASRVPLREQQPYVLASAGSPITANISPDSTVSMTRRSPISNISPHSHDGSASMAGRSPITANISPDSHNSSMAPADNSDRLRNSPLPKADSPQTAAVSPRHVNIASEHSFLQADKFDGRISAQSVDQSFFGVGNFASTPIMGSRRSSPSALKPQAQPAPQTVSQATLENHSRASPYVEMFAQRGSASRDTSPRTHTAPQHRANVIQDPPPTEEEPHHASQRATFGEQMRLSGSHSLQRTLSNPDYHPQVPASGTRSPSVADHSQLKRARSHTPSAATNPQDALPDAFSTTRRSSFSRTPSAAGSPFTPQFDPHSPYTRSVTPTATSVPTSGGSRSVSPESVYGRRRTPDEFLMSLMQTSAGRQFLQTPEGQKVFQEQLFLHEHRSRHRPDQQQKQQQQQHGPSSAHKERPPPYSDEFATHSAYHTPEVGQNTRWPITDPQQQQQSPYANDATDLHVRNTIAVAHSTQQPRHHASSVDRQEYTALLAQQLITAKDDDEAITLLKRLRKHYDHGGPLLPETVFSLAVGGGPQVLPRQRASTGPQTMPRKQPAPYSASWCVVCVFLLFRVVFRCHITTW